MAETYGPPWWTDDERARVKAWFETTEMCHHCCHRVPTAEVEAGLHRHLAVMD